MRIIGTILLWSCLVQSGLAAAPGDIGTFNVTYKLFSSGFELAEMKRTMSRLPDGNYLYRSQTETVGLVAVFYKDKIVEESRWKLEENQIYPLKYTYNRTRSKKQRKVRIDFDWDKKVIHNRVNENLWKMPLEKGMLDKLLYQYAIMRDLPEKPFPIDYLIADGGKMKTYHFERLANEKLQTPLGELETIKLQNIKPNDDRKLIIWCAPKFNYLPVRVEHTDDGRLTTAIIQKLEGL